jgi:low temperature requirement protein LtrA
VAEDSGEIAAGEHAVTPLELFFDLVFVFAITQVTALLTADPTWHGVLRGALVLAAMTAMLGVALAAPGAFGDDALLFGVSFLLVRVSTSCSTRTPAATSPTCSARSLASLPPS